MIDQRSEDWFKQRLGKATASRFHDIMKGERLAGWKNYRAELVIERLTSQPLDNYQSKEMLWGIDNEPLARLLYTLTTGHLVEECGFFEHAELAAGASPDGLVNDDMTIEIKCPNTATHLETLHSKRVPTHYYPQVQGQLWLTGRSSADFVSFDPRLPENAKLVIIHVPRDDEYIKLMEERIRVFLTQVDEEVAFIQNYTEGEGNERQTSGSGSKNSKMRVRHTENAV